MVGTILLYRYHLIKNAFNGQYLFIMTFMSMEYLIGTYEVTLFPGAYSRCGYLTVAMGPYFLKGRLRMTLELAAR